VIYWSQYVPYYMNLTRATYSLYTLSKLQVEFTYVSHSIIIIYIFLAITITICSIARLSMLINKHIFFSLKNLSHSLLKLFRINLKTLFSFSHLISFKLKIYYFFKLGRLFFLNFSKNWFKKSIILPILQIFFEIWH